VKGSANWRAGIVNLLLREKAEGKIIEDTVFKGLEREYAETGETVGERPL